MISLSLRDDILPCALNHRHFLGFDQDVGSAILTRYRWFDEVDIYIPEKRR